MELRVGGKYKITKRLGAGAFGDIFAGVNIKTNEEVAIKLEPIAALRPQLQYEAKIYQRMQGNRKFYYINLWFNFFCQLVYLLFTGMGLKEIILVLL